jgi:deoxyribose-phosphate aldolase
MLITADDFRKKIEFSLCQQFASDDDVRDFVKRARSTGVGVACVNPVNLSLTVDLLQGVEMEISGNVGFPFGSHPPEVKALETDFCIQQGATQIDMVMDIGGLRSNKDDQVLDDIAGVVENARGRIVKVIIEAWVLNEEEKIRASQLVEQAGAHMVKTSTGVRTQYLKLINQDPRGATLEDVALIRSSVSPNIKVKASGGIYSLDDAIDFIKAGADQLGVSRGAELIQEFQERFPSGVDL